MLTQLPMDDREQAGAYAHASQDGTGSCHDLQLRNRLCLPNTWSVRHHPSGVGCEVSLCPCFRSSKGWLPFQYWVELTGFSCHIASPGTSL